MLTLETQVDRFAVVWCHGDSNPKIEHKNTMLPKAAIVALKGLLAWSNFISALDTGMKAHYIILLRTRNDLVFQLADYLGMRWLLLISPLYTWLTGSKFTCNRPRKQESTEQVAVIYAAPDPKGNDANTLCLRD